MANKIESRAASIVAMMTMVFGLLIGVAVGLGVPSDTPPIDELAEVKAEILDPQGGCRYIIDCSPLCPETVDEFPGDFDLTPEGQALYDSADQYIEVQ